MLYMMSQIYAPLYYKGKQFRNLISAKLNKTPGLYPNMPPSPKIDKFEHDKVIDIAYDADSFINCSLQVRIKFSDVYVKNKSGHLVDLQAILIKLL